MVRFAPTPTLATLLLVGCGPIDNVTWIDAVRYANKLS